MKKALAGIKVLDLSRVLAGPFATMILADLGADVIKIEMPHGGDDSRQFGPYVNKESAYFMSINRNKKSMTLNLKKSEGKKLFIDMVKKADVVVENYRPGTMEKLGLGYETLKEINPKIIYASASGFGHTGPYSKRPAYDGVVQAMGGIMSITGQKGGKPTRVGPSIGDVTAGLYTAIGVLAALNYRNESGNGQKVDVAMLDCQVSILENALARYFVTGISPKPEGNRHSSIIPFEPFETSDGEIMIAAGNDMLWKKLCIVMGKEDLAEDERFNTNPLRAENYDILRPLIAQEITKKSTDAWQTILDEAGVPNGPINDIERVVKDPQVLHREMLVEVDHPVAGKMMIPGIPIKMSETQGTIENPAPLLGQHTEEILKEFAGLGEEEIELLKRGEAI
ncbi:CoA:oxalate CoA-transferase [Anaerovirgula multivorans]|uniref:CoA:oxalate CoA-transferase n=1 Tax=Anaerovirgula multivorans TaxID=312168 RepID=A0A239FI79_9FIRM|nr:CaiB/BaiF CoA-transferase family protein [Anaerovirgula multivorans]SNS55983.1 CoA:oxalate CoA-transferase [Anaerovirgula multivorans]